MSKEPQSKPTPDDSEPVKEAPPQLATLPRSYIVRSKTNPRSHFDADYIKELAASIREHGILQPILVRPLPGSRLQETFEDRAPGAPAPTHEIVCGECRWRACELADVDQLPVLVRHLTDLQVLQVQLVENLKRRDLHPLEEAEGFERLMKEHGLTVEDIAARVDKSASQIYVTLKLLELTPECREQLYSGKLTRSTALLVARAPAYLQTQIAKDIMHSGFDDEPMSYRQAQRHIHQNYMLQLANAVFDIKDASLVPKAGACGTCAKNTGANADMFNDVKGGDTCTDPKCFDAKKVAHFAGVAKAAAAKGQVVIQGKEAAALFPTEYSSPKGYHLLDSKDYINGNYTTLRKLAGKDGPAPVIIINPHTKEVQEALPTHVANKLIKKAGGEKKETSKAAAKINLEEQYQESWRARAVEQIHAAVMAGKTQGITVAIARHIAGYYEQSLGIEAAERLGRLFNVAGAKVGAHNAIAEYVTSCPDEMVGPVLLMLMVEDDLEAWQSKFELASLIAADAGVDLDDVQAEVKAQMREAAQAKSAAPAKKEAKGKAKKTSAADAQAGIAKALEAAPPAGDNLPAEIGSRVRIKEGLKGPAGHFRKICGREGVLGPYMGDNWTVRFEGKESARCKRDEFVVLSGPEQPAPNAALAAWPFPTNKTAAEAARFKPL